MRANLKEARKRAGMTQQQMADRLGIKLRAYQNIETGVTLGKVTHWDMLEDMFNVPQRHLREQDVKGGKPMSLSTKVCELERENEALKDEIERLKQLYGDDYKPKRCQECVHFHQHYTKCGSYYFKIDEGHCVAGGRIKKKAAEDERCQFFEKKEGGSMY